MTLQRLSPKLVGILILAACNPADFTRGKKGDAYLGDGSNDRVMCTQLGCAGFQLTLAPHSGVFPAGQYELWTSVDGDEPKQCDLKVTASRVIMPGDWWERPEGCRGLSYYPSTSGINSISVSQYSKLDVLEVVLVKDGDVVQSEQYRPVFETRYPNGPNCGSCESAASIDSIIDSL